jgi:hypothetical protein
MLKFFKTNIETCDITGIKNNKTNKNYEKVNCNFKYFNDCFFYGL